MTAKGQVTVPASVRQALGLEPGSKVQFIEFEDGRFEVKPATVPVGSLKGFFGQWTGPVVTIEEMNAGIAAADGRARTVAVDEEGDVCGGTMELG
ncbi:MAG: AbrB/MazE/SpoVT family DNA-binding domain-containing protein [Bifidobacteriaceae bacterium]|jgi:AbrB family looped-hinge helix DNA binding protein|nr:AbrB/MazE/SpoVT family DNA-binding domain-containing protein [Bifidobacteriaceae bacterium]